MWQATLDRDVGDRIHRLIAACLAEPGRTPEACLHDVLASAPVSGARVVSVRMRLASAAGTYRRRFAPAGARLVGYEMQLGAGVADLVWEHDGMFAVDEVKSGSVDHDDPPLIAQVERFLGGGRALWGAAFAGVRVVPLSRPARSCFVIDVVENRLVTAPAPAWLEVR